MSAFEHMLKLHLVSYKFVCMYHNWNFHCILCSGDAFSALMLLVGRQEGNLAWKNWVVRCWRGYLSGARCRLCIWPSWCHCHSLSLASVKSSRLVLPFWYRLTRVVPDEGPLNGFVVCCCCYCVVVCVFLDVRASLRSQSIWRSTLRTFWPWHWWTCRVSQRFRSAISRTILKSRCVRCACGTSATLTPSSSPSLQPTPILQPPKPSSWPRKWTRMVSNVELFHYKLKVAHTWLPSVGFQNWYIPVLCSQPADDVSHKPSGRLPLLSTRPAVTSATLKRDATNFAAWCMMSLNSLPKTVIRPTGELWRCAVDRGHGGATTRQPSPAMRTW